MNEISRKLESISLDDEGTGRDMERKEKHSTLPLIWAD